MAEKRVVNGKEYTYKYKEIVKTIDGKRKKFRGKTKREAQRKYEEYLEKRNQEVIECSNMLFEELADIWLYDYKSETVREKTFQDTYKNPTERYLKPYFKNKTIADIKTLDIQRFITKQKKFSYSHSHKLFLCLKGMFEVAEYNDLIRKTPVFKIKLPRTPDDLVTDDRAYTKSQARNLIDFAKTHPFGLDAITFLKLGLRPSEFIAHPALLRSNKTGGINYKAKVSSVRQSLSYSRGNIIEPCKNKKSRRDLYFDSEYHEVVLEAFDANPKREYLVSNAKGGLFDQTNWRRRRYDIFMDDFDTYQRELELEVPILLPKELRNSFGSILYEDSKDIVFVSEAMGHSSIETTVKRYIKKDNELYREKFIKFGV